MRLVGGSGWLRAAPSRLSHTKNKRAHRPCMYSRALINSALSQRAHSKEHAPSLRMCRKSSPPGASSSTRYRHWASRRAACSRIRLGWPGELRVSSASFSLITCGGDRGRRRGGCSGEQSVAGGDAMRRHLLDASVPSGMLNGDGLDRIRHTARLLRASEHQAIRALPQLLSQHKIVQRGAGHRLPTRRPSSCLSAVSCRHLAAHPKLAVGRGRALLR